MPEPTPAETIRAAATRLREAAEKATPGPWMATHDPLGHHVEDGRGRGRLVAGFGPADTDVDNRAADAAYVALVNPVVGKALADWLDAAAGHDDATPCPAVDRALAVARALLGSEG